ncbi:MAG: anthranilate 1,2-dioxygenase [Alphaproteobacteria bacterium]|nr:anthranilate 1,2-dioxygenase [Alphaproteobacteria bacterium]
MDVATAFRLQNLLYDSVRAIDDGRLEDWLGYFTDDCLYRITTRENVDQGYPISLVLCTNKQMLKDRVIAIRAENVYKPHYDRHLVANVAVRAAADGAYKVEASYVVYQTDLEGATELFSTGKYDATAIAAADVPKFREMVVTVDTFAIPNHISTPI